MKISELYDFTSIIQEPNNSYNFNPSIAKWKNDLYLCSYRNFNRYKQVNNSSYKSDPLLDPNHPWLGGVNSTTWWNIVDGDDKTGFFIMKLSGNNMSNVKSITPTSIIYRGTFKALQGVDARLLHLQGDYFLLSYNTNIQSDLEIKSGADCTFGCFIIATRLIKINEDGQLIIFQENVVCPSISNVTEKNWSFWVYNNRLFFSYGLSPNHTIYNSAIDLQTGKISCNPQPVKENVGYYGLLEQEYNKYFNEKIFHISVTTPAIPRKNNPNRYIGVGHVKYRNDERIISQIEQSPLKEFYFRYKNFNRHPIYDYLMFIYEFDPRTAQITKITDMFIPGNTSYILSFPSGLEYTPLGDLMISYGDHDSSCRLLIIRENLLDKLLKPIIVFNRAVTPNINNLGFYFFPTNCSQQDGLCSLILET